MRIEYALVAGVLYGMFYALAAVGLNLVFGVLRVVNLAHGDIVVLGSFLAWELFAALHWNAAFSALVALPVAGVAGYGLYWLLAARLARSDDPEMTSFVLFFGISQIIEALATFAFGANQRSLPASALLAAPLHLAGQVYPGTLVASALAAVPLLAALYLYLFRTRAGAATRAVMASPQEAAAVGINVRRISALTFAIGTAAAAAAGAFSIFVEGGTSPAAGVALTTTAFAVIVIGSLGNVAGTVLGGLVYGIADQVTATFASSWANLVPYAILVLVMLARPGGILGRKARDA